jgi:hypothetical protein
MVKLFGVFILIFIVVGIIVKFLWETFFANDEEKAVYDKLIEGGITLILATIPSFSESLLQFLYDFLNVEKSVAINELSPWWLVALGLLLLSVGVILKIIDASAKCVILNMPGTIHHTKDDGILKALNTNNCDEIKISAANCQTEMQKISQTKVNAVLSDIKLQMDRFNRMSNYKRCFTGMAPIPYVILAGTKHTGSDIRYYLEFNKATQQYTKLNNEKKYPKLIKSEIVTIDTNEIVVSVSITAVINDTNTKQFKMPVFNLSLEKTKDNAIYSKKQLNEYVDDTVTFISEVCKKNSNIARVNLLLATQACFAYALGVALVLMQNRVPQIVSYHYVAPSYTTGIVINGRESGHIVKV